jgi:D-alanyl-D-alanine dipeptidase
MTLARLPLGLALVLAAASAQEVPWPPQPHLSFETLVTSRPAPIRTDWRALIGEYGFSRATAYVIDRDGRLAAAIGGLWIEPLQTAAVASDGLHLHGAVLPRRPDPAAPGATFRITPPRPVDQLRREALAARPPAEAGVFRKPELVDITALDATIRLDIRYAGTNNFMGAPVYSATRALLQRAAAEALVRAHRRLRQHGFGLLIHDAYRPWFVTKIFWDATPPEKRHFVANPADGSRHNRGCAVDVTLYDVRTGQPAEMTGGYDEMSERSYPDYPGGTSLQRWHRDLLRAAIEREGFTVYPYEWWHFDYKDWRNYPILNLPFENIR